MAEGGVQSIFNGITFRDIIMVASVGGAIVAQWSIMSSAMSKIEPFETRLAVIESRINIAEYKLDSLKDQLTELRRQSNLMEPKP